MNYENATDFEINSAVTAYINNCAAWELNDAEFYHCGIDGSAYYSIPILDYCNNPADAWPIIQSAKISLIKTDDDCWTAFEWKNDENEIWHKNPLRSAMIVYLMMNEDKK